MLLRIVRVLTNMKFTSIIIYESSSFYVALKILLRMFVFILKLCSSFLL